MNKVGWIVASLLVSGAVVAEPFSPSDKEYLIQSGWPAGYHQNQGIFVNGGNHPKNTISLVIEYKKGKLAPYFVFNHAFPCHTREDETGEPILDDREFRINGESYEAKKYCYTVPPYMTLPESYGSKLTPTTQAGIKAIYEAFKNNEYVTVDLIYDKAVFWSYGFDKINKITRKKSQQQ